MTCAAERVWSNINLLKLDLLVPNLSLVIQGAQVNFYLTPHPTMGIWIHMGTEQVC